MSKVTKMIEKADIDSELKEKLLKEVERYLETAYEPVKTSSLKGVLNFFENVPPLKIPDYTIMPNGVSHITWDIDVGYFSTTFFDDKYANYPQNIYKKTPDIYKGGLGSVKQLIDKFKHGLFPLRQNYVSIGDITRGTIT